MLLQKNLLIFILLLMFLGCSNFTSDDDKYLPVEGRIFFNLNEGFTEEDTSKTFIKLLMVTEKEYPCYNYDILNEIIIHENTIFVDILGIRVPEIGLTAIGPAYSQKKLDISNGSYSLHFRYYDFLDSYLIDMNDTFIKINRVVSKYTQAVYLKYYRRPKNSFMSKSHNSEKYHWIYDAFLDTLKNTIEIEGFSFPDDGVVGYTGCSNANQENEKINFFYYKNENEFDIAGQKLKQFTDSLSNEYPGIFIDLLNFKNKLYYSR